MIVKGRALVEKSRRYRDHYPKSSIAYAYEAGYKAALRDMGSVPREERTDSAEIIIREVS